MYLKKNKKCSSCFHRTQITQMFRCKLLVEANLKKQGFNKGEEKERREPEDWKRTRGEGKRRLGRLEIREREEHLNKYCKKSISEKRLCREGEKGRRETEQRITGRNMNMNQGKKASVSVSLCVSGNERE